MYRNQFIRKDKVSAKHQLCSCKTPCDTRTCMNFPGPCRSLSSCAPGNTCQASWLQRRWVREEVRLSFHAFTCLSAPRTDSQTNNLSPDRAGEERNSITPHRTPFNPPSNHPPPPFPNTFHPFSLPPLSFPAFSVFIFIRRFISDAFIHFQYLYVWLCLPPFLPPPPYLPVSILPSLFCFLPCFLSYLQYQAFAILPSFRFLFSLLSPSHYCNPSLFHQPPCKQTSWLP